jgi:hypothetical protein
VPSHSNIAGPFPLSPLGEQYHRSWQAERSVDGLERFLARRGQWSVAELVEVLLVDQRLQWQSGCRPSVEEYLERCPAVADQREAVLELVYGEIRAARELGLPIEADAYADRFPDLTGLLRRQLEVAAWFARTEDGEADTLKGT